MCGKYNSLQDAYKSIVEAFIHAGIANSSKVEVKWVDTEKIDTIESASKELSDVDGVLIPGGFGNRGIEGKILSSRYARENNIPFFGICLGLQCAVIDFARNECGMEGANSSEFDGKTKYPVIDIMSSQKSIKKKGATMRLGSYGCNLTGKSKVYAAYGKRKIYERHRHRFEFNNKYRSKLEAKGLVVSGTNKELNLVEIVEVKSHPWFVATQFHPELKSRVVNVHPLFKDFVGASIKRKYGSH
ncbi:MAG: CTP synthase [bacterium TMED198]|nr:MAG: CTP synthase [bacterium TMED198]